MTPRWSRWLALAGWCAAWTCSADVSAQDASRATRIREATLQLRFDEAARLLDAADASDPTMAIERGRYLYYATRYDEAVVALDRPDVASTDDGARLGGLARACARAMAGALVVTDKVHRIVVRMQDDRDQVLVPILGQVVEAVRVSLDRDLGLTLPIPLRIELVRDHFSLSEMTGLPESSARTTGTVAIANWGRVTMISPRTMRDGYPWEVTLAHELTHVALGMGTIDRAPLWFQEGIAKLEETRWRSPDPWDDYPSSDSVAAVGYDLGLARDIEHVGPSFAMLPTAQEAMVAFAQAHSLVRYIDRHGAPRALADIIAEMRDGPASDDPRNAVERATGRPLEDWVASWRVWLESVDRSLPPEVGLGARAPAQGSVGRDARLGELLQQRSKHQAAVVVLSRARDLAPNDLRLRGMLAESLLAMGRSEQASAEVEVVGPPYFPDATALAIRGFLLAARGDWTGAKGAFDAAVALAPWKAKVACEWLDAPATPTDPDRAALCHAARLWPID
jgi:tetratricopeptide (TPR) repeat protein